MNEYKDNPTYQAAMRRLGVLNAKKHLGSSSNAAAACPLPKATEEQKRIFIQARSDVRVLLHPEETPASSLHPGAAAERDRLEEIDAIADLYGPKIVREAKYGCNPISAEEMVIRAARGIANDRRALPESYSTATTVEATSPASAQSPVEQTRASTAVVPYSLPQSSFARGIMPQSRAYPLSLHRGMIGGGMQPRYKPKARMI